MDASQLKISPEHLRFKPMTRAEKLRLRRENVKALIKSKPSGTILTMTDFATVCATSKQNVSSMINTLVRRGILTKIPSEVHPQRYSWIVNEPSAVTVRTASLGLRYDLVTLTQKAKEFAWEHNSDSLREFIKSLGGKDE